MINIFHSLQSAPAFFRTRMALQGKASKDLSVSLPTNAVALTLDYIKECKITCADTEIYPADLETTILDCLAVGSSRLQPDWFPTMKVWVFIIKNVEF